MLDGQSAPSACLACTDCSETSGALCSVWLCFSCQRLSRAGHSGVASTTLLTQTCACLASAFRDLRCCEAFVQGLELPVSVLAYVFPPHEEIVVVALRFVRARLGPLRTAHIGPRVMFKRISPWCPALFCRWHRSAPCVGCCIPHAFGHCLSPSTGRSLPFNGP